MKNIKKIARRIIKELRKKYSVLLFKSAKLEIRNKKKISEIKDIHKGKRAFIICNGPSLNPIDLDKISNNKEISFSSNKIDKIFKQTKWRPTYYTVVDEKLQYKLLKTMNEVPAKIKFFRIESFSTTRKVNGNCIFLNADGNRKLLDHPLFAENCTNKIYTIATVTYAMFQLAVHMGIKEIYIIGCDNSYAQEINKDGRVINNRKQKSYFSGSEDKDMKVAAATWEMNIAYKFAREYADSHKIKIYNATRGGYLEAFERVDFDSLF